MKKVPRWSLEFSLLLTMFFVVCSDCVLLQTVAAHNLLREPCSECPYWLTQPQSRQKHKGGFFTGIGVLPHLFKSSVVFNIRQSVLLIVSMFLPPPAFHFCQCVFMSITCCESVTVPGVCGLRYSLRLTWWDSFQRVTLAEPKTVELECILLLW